MEDSQSKCVWGGESHINVRVDQRHNGACLGVCLQNKTIVEKLKMCQLFLILLQSGIGHALVDSVFAPGCVTLVQSAGLSSPRVLSE